MTTVRVGQSPIARRCWRRTRPRHWPFPADFTPVCTSELGEFARRQKEFDDRNTKLLGVSVDSVESHRGWSADIAETQGQGLNFPLVGDEDRTVAELYGMIHPQALQTATVRTVFVIGPDKQIKLTLTYPAAIGRKVDEILRVLDALHLPGHLRRGRCGPLPTGFTTLRPCLRLTPQPNR